MKIFTTITENPVFALNITEMVYDARIFSSHMLASGVYEKAFRSGFPPGHPVRPIRRENGDEYISNLPASKCPASRQCYASLLQEQIEIFEASKDLVTLSAGLSRLPNLMRISVQDILEHYSYRAPDAIDNHQWYHDWSDHTFKGIMPPSRWNGFEMADRGQTLQQHPWDFRGIDSLWQAVVTSQLTNLRELRIGCHNSKLSEELYNRSNSAEAFSKLAAGLTKLRLDTKRSGIADQDLSLAAKILEKAHQLEVFSLNHPDDFPSLAKSWPRLRILNLSHGYVHAAELEAVVLGCASTLRELGLRVMCLWDRDKAWEDCGRDLGRHLKLRFILVRSLSRFDPILDHMRQTEQGEVELTARNIMGNVPESNIGFDSSDRSHPVIAWRKDEYVPNLGHDPHWNED